MRNLSILVILFYFISFNSFSQNFIGKIYDEKSTVKDIKVYNKTNNHVTYTNELGDFTIKATVDDTIIFTSIFYEKKLLHVLPEHFDDIVVIELVKTIYNLDEILLTDSGKEKPFNEITQSQNLSFQLKNDIKNNPHLYGVMPAGGIDIVKIATLISGLFKKKNKQPSISYADYKDLDSLFTKKNIFTNDLIKNELKIPFEFKLLFFDYCATKYIDKKLLLPKNELALLNKLFIYSEEFLLILKDSKNKK